MVNTSGTTVVEYSYDSWGNVLNITGSLKETVGKQNPFRYRGYYYDAETGMYYLKSRYYDPEIRRFISADTLISTTLLGKNVYCYCENEPIVQYDPSGHSLINPLEVWNKLLKFIHYYVRNIKNNPKPTYNEVNNKKNNWTKVPDNQTKYHDNRKGKMEEKYTHTDGREIVFDGDTLQPVLESKYMGTYNFCPVQQLSKNPTLLDHIDNKISMIGHSILDVVPYFIWGNSPDDPTTMGERIMMSFN